MDYFRKLYQLADNYLFARLQNRPSTALFWYLPEPPYLQTKADLSAYQRQMRVSPFYLIDYRQKLSYSLKNKSGIIVLPYAEPIGQQINPEAAFQYALGLHDHYLHTQEAAALRQFFQYADFFAKRQTKTGLWTYDFDWFGSKAPWASALAQARGASVMLRAGILSKNEQYYELATKALMLFLQPTSAGGFSHIFTPEACPYYEEYPQTPSGVLNGFMAALMSIWELQYWLKESWLKDLWQQGLNSLEKMLPYYSTGWWSLYDLDYYKGLPNVNSPRYHLLEIHYLKVLSLLSDSSKLSREHEKRLSQYQRLWLRWRAFRLKLVRKIVYK
ncbi:MAG TPA: D-glucuronyl C5-epimerase family protein [Gammaproteobacteria bacterium]|nr:D-glucuronyl C5-epimerase family protein [Gammaproteobacteria bacterium]